MKKIIVQVVVIMTLILAGCAQTKDMEIVYKELSQEESQLLTLTGNNIMRYNIKNLPNDKDYELKLVYEVYENKEKVKDETIMAMAYEASDEKLQDLDLWINIQEGKIRCLKGGAYAYYDVEENIENLSREYFSKSSTFDLGDEVYLFRGVGGKNGMKISELGVVSDKDSLLEGTSNVFIKLVCEEK